MITLSRDVYDDIVEHAISGTPSEVCGVLGGEHGDDRSHVTVVRRTANVADTPQSTYRIDPAEQIEVMDEIEEDGRDVVGFYHSHPNGPPRPSVTDTAQAHWTNYSYLIVDFGGRHPYVGCWRWTGERFEPERLSLR